MEHQGDEEKEDEASSKSSDSSSEASLEAVTSAKLPAKMRQQGAYGSEDASSLAVTPLPDTEELPSNAGTAVEETSAGFAPALTRVELQDELRVFAAGAMRVELSTICQKLREAMNELEKSFRKEINNIYEPAEELPKGMNGHQGHKAPLDLEGAEEWASPGAEDYSAILQNVFAASKSLKSDRSADEEPVSPKGKIKGYSRGNADSRRGSKSSLTTQKLGKRGRGRNSLTQSRARAHSLHSASSTGSMKSRQSAASNKPKSANLWRQRKSNMSAENVDEDILSSDGTPQGSPASPPQQPVRRRSFGNIFNDAMGSAVGLAGAVGSAVVHSAMPSDNAKVAPEPTQKRRPSMSNIMMAMNPPCPDSDDEEDRKKDRGSGGADGPQNPKLKSKKQKSAQDFATGGSSRSKEAPSPGRWKESPSTDQEDRRLHWQSGAPESPPALTDAPMGAHASNGFEPAKSEGSHENPDCGASIALLSDAGASCSSEDSCTFGFRHRRGFVLSEEFRRAEGLLNGDGQGNNPRRSSNAKSVNEASVLPGHPEEARKMSDASSELLSFSDKGKRFILHEKVTKIVESAEFDYVSATLILLNAVLLGTQTDYGARNLGGEEPLVFFIFDRLFCYAFTGELMMRIYVHRLHFFFMTGWRWSLFDIFVVGMQVIEEVTLYVGIASGVTIGQPGEEAGGNFGVLRMIRVLRLVRIIRLARIMHLIGELRTIVVGIFSSMQSLFWTLVLLFLVIYIMAVYITQTVSDHLLTLDLSSTESPSKLTAYQEDLIRYYGSVPQAILTLYQAISGGMNWGVSSDPLMHSISPGLGLLFSVYIGFSIFCLMNITTGVFVESALETAKSDRELFLLHHAHELFRDVDIDGTGTVTWEEFQNHLDKPEMQMYFQAIDLDPDEAEDLFHILDVGGHGYLDVQEFVNGCLRLRGPAKAIDLATFMHEYSKSMKRVQKLIGKVEKSVGFVTRNMVKRRQAGRESSTDGEPHHGKMSGIHLA